ncbi:hypothetical protein WMY93_021095 [Mugilogobius chulae]|uniref:Homeobox domain-containing protein n=1 Tax=Mugilogobius chulae TaxID=88201 RepID=A0AAW0NB89_9GOBI
MLAVGPMDGSRQSAFLLSTPPLAALHSMTEMKTPLYPAYPLSSSGPNSSTSPATTSPNPGGMAVSSPGIKSSTGLSSGLGSPQHCSDSRRRGLVYSRYSVRTAPVQQLKSATSSWTLLQSQRRRGGRGPVPQTFGGPPGKNAYLLAGGHAEPHWRDARFACSPHQNSVLLDKDGKRKHTRPTFSGQQIFALEKTFEQTKYLAGPERARLAYSLGMTESQVKVQCTLHLNLLCGFKTEGLNGGKARGGNGHGQKEAGLGDRETEGHLGQRRRRRRLQQTTGPKLRRREDHTAAEKTQTLLLALNSHI